MAQAKHVGKARNLGKAKNLAKAKRTHRPSKPIDLYSGNIRCK